jgi:hypothetical protein
MKGIAISAADCPEATSSFAPHFQQNSRFKGFLVVQFWQ